MLPAHSDVHSRRVTVRGGNTYFAPHHWFERSVRWKAICVTSDNAGNITQTAGPNSGYSRPDQAVSLLTYYIVSLANPLAGSRTIRIRIALKLWSDELYASLEAQYGQRYELRLAESDGRIMFLHFEAKEQTS